MATADVVQSIVDRVCSLTLLERLRALVDDDDTDTTSSSSWLADMLRSHMADRVAESCLGRGITGATLASDNVAISSANDVPSSVLRTAYDADTMWADLCRLRTISVRDRMPPVLTLARPLAWLAVGCLRTLIIDNVPGAMPAAAICQLPRLCVLTITRCGMATWPDAVFFTLPDLCTVDFHDNGMSGRAIGLRQLRSLEYVDLSDNKLSMPVAGQWLVPDPPPRLQYLNVARAFAPKGSRARRMHMAIFTKADAVARNVIYITE